MVGPLHMLQERKLRLRLRLPERLLWPRQQIRLQPPSLQLLRSLRPRPKLQPPPIRIGTMILLCSGLHILGSLLTIRLQRVGLLLTACLGVFAVLHPVGLLHSAGFSSSRARL